MKKITLIFLLLSNIKIGFSQEKGFNPNYKFVHSANLIVDKNFWLLPVIDQHPEVATLIRKDPTLSGILTRRVELLKKHSNDTCSYPATLVADFKYTIADSIIINDAVKALYSLNRNAFDIIIENDLRPSGYYQRFASLTNQEVFLKAWGQYIYGINHIIDQFGLGKHMLSPKIDSANYAVNSNFYRLVLKDIFSKLDEQTDNMRLFYQPSLAIAIELMDANDRDEAARFEPMEEKVNKKAFERIKQIQWTKYEYAAIVIPGNGPEIYSIEISPESKIRCDIAAIRFLKGLAPFIITSGGFVTPFRGPYCEAFEMKKYLMTKYRIPEDAIIIDPHARRTRTNFRDANRLIIRYGIPIDKPSLFLTSKSQHDQVMNDEFDRRNLRLLGYLPYRDKKSISNHDIIFYPVLESLHMDPIDPMDP